MADLPRTIVKESNLHYNGVYGKSYTFLYNYTLKEVKDIIESFHNHFRNSGKTGHYIVNALFALEDNKPARWYALTRMNNVNSDKVRWSLQEYDSDYTEGGVNDEKIKAVQIIYFPDSNEPEGGCGAHNDCLYDCLMRYAPTITKRMFSTPSKLKKFCNLSRNDKVPAKFIKDIEAKMPYCKIVVSGDYEYNSKKAGNYIININLKNNHYEPGKVVNIYRVKGIAYQEKKPVIYKFISIDKVLLYDGEKKFSWTREKFYKVKRNHITGDFIFIKSETGKMKNDYKEFIKKADFLKKVTNGQYNLYKTGSEGKASLYRFYTLNRGLAVEEIDTTEAKWIFNTMKAALIWSKKDYEGPVHEYDINSAYPYIYSHNLFQFPIKCGVFKHLTNKEFQNSEYINYGIYRCKITGIDTRLFRENPECYYTHYDLMRAQQLGYKIHLIEDDDLPNALIYPSNTRINGQNVFGTYVSELQNLITQNPKEKPLFKKLLNILWGALCQHNKKVSLLFSEEDCEVKGDDILVLKPSNFDERYYICKALDYKNIFDTPFARIGPFILSKMRYILSRLIEPHLEHIVRIHTDGFFSTKELTFEKTSNSMDSLVIGTEMGNIKHIYHEYVKILNTSRIIKE